MHKIVNHLVATSLILCANPAHSEDEKNKAERINLAYTAWQCANIAAHSNDHTHHVERLFEYGMDSGKTFMEDAETGNISSERFHDTIFWIVSTVLAGGGGDFMLGRLFQLAQNTALEEYNEQPFDQELAKVKMDNLFREKNCNYIGR